MLPSFIACYVIVLLWLILLLFYLVEYNTQLSFFFTFHCVLQAANPNSLSNVLPEQTVSSPVGLCWSALLTYSAVGGSIQLWRLRCQAVFRKSIELCDAKQITPCKGMIPLFSILCSICSSVQCEFWSHASNFIRITCKTLAVILAASVASIAVLYCFTDR